MKFTKLLIATLLIFNFQFSIFNSAAQNQRVKYNFNSDWEIHVGDGKIDNLNALKTWQSVTLPHAFNENEAFRLSISEHTDTIVWYRKHFRLPANAKGQKIFLEFEGIRFGGDFYVNGQHVGLHENGVMAFGFDITDFVDYGKENTVAARIDNSWRYKERATGSGYQWNDRNFYANYGGINKNVYLHVTPRLYQTLPLYSNLNTTGTYIYAREIDITRKTAMIYAESEIKNEFQAEKEFVFDVKIEDMDGKIIKTFSSKKIKIAAGETQSVKIGERVNNLHFWSWGYGYLYNVYTSLTVISANKQRIAGQTRNDNAVDVVKTRTGFRKTRFADGLVWLNDRVIQIKGYAERTTNEWVAVGQSVPAWMSDYTNRMMVESGANTVRWMHVTPWKQDVESCDRVGLMQLMPAGDSEKDVADRRWGHRVELMRDAIIYNRNNPSVVFYEGGNEAISEEHMQELKDIRDKYDPYGGRAIGSREMLDSRVAEWGGEMLYINKSAHIPMFATEYCRDEALRWYWDDPSYPYHPDGVGVKYGTNIKVDTATVQWKDMMQQPKDAWAYNRNQDSFFKELITRWWDYYRVRPGTGKRISSGGLKIHFHESNTHWRGEQNYRRSGVVDAVRLPKDVFFAHQVMWNGWVDIEKHGTYICGHWNYEQTQDTRRKTQDGEPVVAGLTRNPLQKDVLVCSTADSVVLFVNNTKYIDFERTDNFRFTFKNVKYEAGKIEAISYDKNGKILSSNKKETAGVPHHIKLTPIIAPDGFKADGADIAIVEIEIVDKEGRRCPLDNSMIDFKLEGAGVWLGGMATGDMAKYKGGNFVGETSLPVECGVNRVLIRSTTKSGKIKLTTKTTVIAGLIGATIELNTLPFKIQNGLSTYISSDYQPSYLQSGETPKGESFTVKRKSVEIVSATAGANEEKVRNAFDDNELSEWQNDGKLSSAWIKFELANDAAVNQVEMKLTGWRMRSYPIQIFVDDKKVWEGNTEKSLGYINILFSATKGRFVTIQLNGTNSEEDAFGGIVEVAAPAAGELDLFKAKDGDKTRNELRIVEMEVYEKM